MDRLIIRLTGRIEDSNFDEWKEELIDRIQSVNTVLVTEEDFAVAAEQVKAFKAAEKALQEAKASAIEQAADIQKLFGAIDEISGESREARLSLERQIRRRKEEIKREIIDAGIESIRSFIEQQGDDFQQLDHDPHLDRRRFEEAARRKTTIRTLQRAIDDLCFEIREEITKRAEEAAANGVLLDSLPADYRLLFQDRGHLLSLERAELDLTIDKRIAQFKEAQARAKAEKARRELQRLEEVELDPEAPLPGAAPVEEASYRLIIDMRAAKERAVETARAIRESLAGNPAVTGFRLTRLRDD